MSDTLPISCTNARSNCQTAEIPQFSLSLSRSSLPRYYREIYRDWIAGVRLVPDAQLPVTVPAPDVKLPLVGERQGVRVAADYLD